MPRAVGAAVQGGILPILHCAKVWLAGPIQQCSHRGWAHDDVKGPGRAAIDTASADRELIHSSSKQLRRISIHQSRAGQRERESGRAADQLITYGCIAAFVGY